MPKSRNRKILGGQKGQGMAEYAIIFALVVIVVAVALPSVAPPLTAMFERLIAQF